MLGGEREGIEQFGAGRSTTLETKAMSFRGGQRSREGLRKQDGKLGSSPVGGCRVVAVVSNVVV